MSTVLKKLSEKMDRAVDDFDRAIAKINDVAEAMEAAPAPCMADAARALPNVVPDGMKVTPHCWKEKANGPRLHNRYVITDVGGVQFGDSIERGESGHLDRVSIFEQPSRGKLWEQFVAASPAFDVAGPTREFEGRRGPAR